MGFGWKHAARATVATLVAAGALMAEAATADAAPIMRIGQSGLPGLLVQRRRRTREPGAGRRHERRVHLLHRGRRETGATVGTFDGTWQDASSDDEKTAAWMIEATKNDSTDLVQAAAAYAIHEHLDEGSSQWQTVKRTGFDTTEDVAVKANELWDPTKNKIVKSANWEKARYTKGMAQGVATAELLDKNGHYIGGVPYTVEYDDKLVKVDNPSGVTSSDGPVAINWTAISNGEVRNFHVKYDVQTLAKLIPRTGQHKMRLETRASNQRMTWSSRWCAACNRTSHRAPPPPSTSRKP